MIVLSAALTDCVARSANVDHDWLGEVMRHLPQSDIAALAPGRSPISLGNIEVAGEVQALFAHRTTTDLTLLEFEPAVDAVWHEAPIYALTREFLPRLQQSTDLAALFRLVAAEMKRLTQFGRCLVYRFNEDGHGEVLAEELDTGYDSYAGHHFPASDIPQQARDLYVLNQFRLIPDANYTPVPLVADNPSLFANTIDLSRAQLRSVSPVHLEYMRNMGTLASMSVSIVIDGRLWGLISCHNHSPRTLAAPTRLACEHLGQLLAMQVQAKESNQAIAERLELRKLTLEAVSRLADSDATLRTLVGEPWLILRMAKAAGAAVVLDDQTWSVGDVPDEEELLRLSRWIGGLGQQVYHSSALSLGTPGHGNDRGDAAGVLAISISQVHRHQVLWFRPEMVKTITWAGNPRKAHVADDGRIHPRLSFESWVQEVRGASAAWTDAQVSAVGELRQALIGVVLRRAEEVAAVATELGRVNKELEAFSYTVSHDLRAPMRHIAGYVDLVVEQEGKALGDRSLRYLGHVKEAAAFAGQLVDALLDFSRMGRSALKRREVDLGALVEGLVRELTRPNPSHDIEWTIEPDLPVLHADPLLMQVAIRNLLANAIKYSRGARPVRIAVRAVSTADSGGLEIQDNGVGFQMKYANKLFGVFQRLHNADEFEGTGIGLANVKRIVERHGGTVWAHGEVGKGASFGFSLPRALVEESTQTPGAQTDA